MAVLHGHIGIAGSAWSIKLRCKAFCDGMPSIPGDPR